MAIVGVEDDWVEGGNRLGWKEVVVGIGRRGVEHAAEGVVATGVA
jgi:hypothetical protein